MGFKLGLLARSDTGGLAAQTEDFYRHMKPAKTLVVDISHLTGYPNDFSKYPDGVVAQGFEIQNSVIDTFLEGLDVVFTVECPYNHYLYTKAREMGVKTVCQYNWEWLEHHQRPNLPLPDLFLAPSSWYIKDMEKFGVPVKYLHVPIDREKFPYHGLTRAKKFLHIAGHRTFGDRNGTAILLDALPYIESDIEITIRTQDELPRPYTDSKLTIVKNDIADRRGLYNNEDVLILPRKYGGLSLQLNEAMSLGMIPLMLDIPPQNKFLPKACLVPSYFKETTMVKTSIPVHECSPQMLAKKIDELASSKKISYLSKESNDYARSRDWKVMKPHYEALFESLCP